MGGGSEAEEVNGGGSEQSDTLQELFKAYNNGVDLGFFEFPGS